MGKRFDDETTRKYKEQYEANRRKGVKTSDTGTKMSAAATNIALTPEEAAINSRLPKEGKNVGNYFISSFGDDAFSQNFEDTRKYYVGQGQSWNPSFYGDSSPIPALQGMTPTVHFSDIKRAEYDAQKQRSQFVMDKLQLDRDMANDPFYNPNANVDDPLEQLKTKPINFTDIKRAEYAQAAMKDRLGNLEKVSEQNAQDRKAAKERAETKYGGNLNPHELPTETTPVNPEERPWFRRRKALGLPYQISDRDYSYDNDFDEYWEVRSGKAKKNIKPAIMAKNHWTEEEFDRRFAEYKKEREQNEALEAQANAEVQADENPIFTSAMTVMATPGEVIEGIGNIEENLRGNPVGLDNLHNMPVSTLKRTTRNVVGENINEGLGGGVPGWAGRFAYGTGMSALDRMYMTLYGGKVGAALMGGSVAAQNTLDALERGVDPTKAGWTGTLEGAASVPLEMIGFDWAVGKEGPSALWNLLRAGASEGLEEVSEEVANTFIDSVINQDQSELATLYDYYRAQGMSDNDAWWQVAKDKGIDLVGAGLTGAAFGAFVRARAGNLRTPEVPKVDNDAMVDFFGTEPREGMLRAPYSVPEVVTNNVEVPPAPKPKIPTVDLTDAEKADLQAELAEDLGWGNTNTPKAGDTAPTETLNNAGIPKSVSDQIAEAIQKDNFTPITFTDTDGYTHIIFKSTRPGEKWQVSHLDETGRAVGHNAYANDADMLRKLKMDDAVGNLVEINTSNNILTQPEVTINDMVNNPDAFSLEDFGRALKTIDRNADTFDASKEDIIEALRFNMNEAPETGEIPVKVSSETYASVQNDKGIDEIKIQQTSGNFGTDNNPSMPRPSAAESSDLNIPQNGQNVNPQSVPEVVSSPNGETPRAEVPNVKPTEGMESPEVPNANGTTTPANGEEKVRSFSKRGSQDETLPDEVRNDLKEDKYKVVRNADVEQRANELFDPNNLTQTRSNLKQAIDNHDPAASLLAYKLANKYVDEGNYDAARDVIEEVSKELTRSGQFSQAAKLAMMKNNPMAALKSYMRDLAEVNKWGKKKFGKKWKNLELSDADIKAFNDITEGDADALNSLVNDLNKKFAKQVPASWWDKFIGTTKISMLLNLRTQGRNIFANVAMLPIRSASDRVAAVGENIVHLINPDVEVTQSVIGGTREQKKIAGEIFEDLKDSILNENKMKDANSSEILSRRRIFRDDPLAKGIAKFIDHFTKGKLGNINERLGADANYSTMETLSNFTYWLMGDFGDTPFVKKNFVNRLASYMKAQGITDINDVPDEAIAIATQEALKATFKDDNAFSRALAGTKQKWGKFGEVAFPFVKTPANLAMRAVDYSPAGLINAFRKIKSGADANAIIADVSKSLTGSALMFLGYALRKKGLLSGNYSDDKDEKAWQKQHGVLENALHIGDKYFSIDWAQPACTPIILGSVMYDAINNSDKENAGILSALNSSYKGVGNVVNSWLETSPVKSLSDMLGNNPYGDDLGVAGNIMQEIIELPQRLIPAQLGAAARSVDPVIRDTYSSDNSLTGILKNEFLSAASKIPYVSKTLPASYDTWGNERTRNDTEWGAALSQNLNPGQLGNDNPTPLDDEIQRLYTATGSGEVFPYVAARSLTMNGESVKLTNEQHSEYQRIMGQQSYQMADALMNSEAYKTMTDAEKVSALKSIYDLSNSMAKEKVFDYVTDDDKNLKEIYRTQGAQAAVDRMIIKSKASSLDMDTDTYIKKEAEYPGGADGYAKDREAGKALGMKADEYRKAEDSYPGGAAAKAQDKQTAEQYGFTNKDGNVNMEAYDKAIEVVGNDPNAISGYANYRKQGMADKTRGEKITYLINNNTFTDEAKGKMVSEHTDSEKLDKGAKGAYDIGGWSDVYYYYLIRDLADFNGDGNGTLSGKEIRNFLDNGYDNGYAQYLNMLSQEMYNYLYSYKK